jgi:hypothetical protein
MQSELLIFDEFYTNPYNTIDYALTMEWHDDYGQHPGKRTKEEQDQSTFDFFSYYMENVAGKITRWRDMLYNGCFNLVTAKDRTWIHADCYNDWAAVVYLTPNAPISSGTGLYRHIETGLDKVPRDANGEIDQDLLDYIYKDAQDWTKWQLVDYVANKFNRAVVYRGDLFHSAVNYFGNDFTDGRMHQTFFFNTER